MTTTKKKQKRTFDIRDYIDDDVDSGEVVEDQKLHQDEQVTAPKETIKKRTKKQRDAEQHEEDQYANHYEIDEEAEKESKDDHETRERQHLLFLRQEDENWKDVDEFAQRFEAEEKEKCVQLLELKQNIKLVQDSRAQILEKSHSAALVQGSKNIEINAPKEIKPIPLQKANFKFDCVWCISANQYLVHRIGLDQLGTLTIEKEYIGFKEKINSLYAMLYPFENSRDALLLQKIAPQLKWYEVWIMPVSRLPHMPRSLRLYIEQERKGVLSECCEAFWPIENGEFYVVHFAFFPCKHRNSLLSVSFHVVEAAFCPYLFTKYHRSLIMMPDVVARYPWKNGNDALTLLQAHQSDTNLTYQELKSKISRQFSDKE